MRPDARGIEKSLLEPALHTPHMNELEAAFAGYLDEREALRWWHRNVARTQYGLQGWRRHKVYPDFVFARVTGAGGTQIVVMERPRACICRGRTPLISRRCSIA